MARKLPTFFSRDEAIRLVAAAPSRRDRLMITLMLLTGLRVSELCNLRIEHLDFIEKRLLVYQGKGAKDRMIPLSRKLIDPLRHWIAGRTHGLVFPSKRTKGPICPRTVQYMIKKAGAKAGIQKWVKPHACRHSFATQLLSKAGANIRQVQTLMGHASIGTTEIYTHVTPEELAPIVDNL